MKSPSLVFLPIPVFFPTKHSNFFSLKKLVLYFFRGLDNVDVHYNYMLLNKKLIAIHSNNFFLKEIISLIIDEGFEVVRVKNLSDL